MQEGQLTPEQVIPVGPDQQLWQLALLNDGVGTRAGRSAFAASDNHLASINVICKGHGTECGTKPEI
jgi:hypothetical protein